MNYLDYCHSRDAAWKMLIDCKIQELPIKIVKLCKTLGIQVKSYESTDGNDGYCKMYPNEPFIFVNTLCSKNRQRFTVAHELGHIVLGHVGKYTLVNREPSANDNPIEAEANVFASRLLAPACVLHEIGVKSPQEISELCGISLQSAQIRFQRFLELEERNAKFLAEKGVGCYYLSPLERQVAKQFKNFILKKKL